MLRSKRILAVDVGASKVVLAEFEAVRGSPPQLLRYGIAHLGINPEHDSHTPAILVTSLRELLREHAIKPAPVYLSISGQAVFPRFVKLPPVSSRDKLDQIVLYEAEQNVPFPINEVVWDYQLLPTQSETDLHVMLVAVKVENVTRLTDCMQATHLEPRVVDAAPMALYNALCHNYPDLEGCTMLLDIGARSSNLIFAEEHRVFTRSVPVAGNTITQEIAKQLNISFAEAEELKKAHAQVDLGGNFEGGAEGPGLQISKIVRNVMTRLHAEVNRSINFYRSQQGGGAPLRVYLAGGTSIMPYTDVFFRDKLNVEVEYFNPFARIPVAPSIDEEQIGRDVHLLGEAVGLALRHNTDCPVAINLMPPDLVALKTFRKRQPYFAAAAAGVVLALLTLWGLSRREHALLKGQLARVNGRLAELSGVQGRLDTAAAGRADALNKANDVAAIINRRSGWITILETLHASLLDGMWITGLTPTVEENGTAVKLTMTGKGFEDELAHYDLQATTAIEQFRDRLRKTALFSEQTEITAQPPSAPGDFRRDFTIELVLEKPLKVRQAP